VGSQGRANQALDALRSRRLETQLTATGIDGRPHAIQGALMWHYLIGHPVDELVGILNTRLAKTEGSADLGAVILDRAAAPVVRDIGFGWDADLAGQMRHNGGRHLVLAVRKSAFVTKEREQCREPKASRARLVGQQGLIARLQGPLSRQFIVVPQALHRVLPVANYRVESVSWSGPRHGKHECALLQRRLNRGAGEFNRPIGMLNSTTVNGRQPPGSSMALPSMSARVLSNSAAKPRSVKPTSKRWQPPEGLAPEEIGAIIDAAASERDRLLLTTLWATGARISEVLTLRPRDIHRDGLVLPNLKNPSRLVKTAHLSAAHAGLPGDLLVWARENGLADDEPLFFSRQHGADGRHKAIDRVRAWKIVKAASEQADVRVLALRATGHGAIGEPAPVHPHLFRHARVRQIVRHTRSLALAQKQAGWARLHTEYLSLSDDEAQRLMQDVPE
jgi:integrase